MSDNIYAFKARALNGDEVDFNSFKGKVLLIVNTASKCGFTSQYKGLESLYQQHKNSDFLILGFPCNQFGGQEPGDSEEISEFCQLNFGVSFPMFEKVDVNGDQAHPLFKYLREKAPGILGSQAIKWNFTKFLINREGVPEKRFAPNDSPEKIGGELTSFLN